MCLKYRVSEGEGEAHTQRFFNQWFTPHIAATTQGWTRSMLGAWNSIWDSQVDARGPYPVVYSATFPGA